MTLPPSSAASTSTAASSSLAFANGSWSRPPYVDSVIRTSIPAGRSGSRRIGLALRPRSPVKTSRRRPAGDRHPDSVGHRDHPLHDPEHVLVGVERFDRRLALLPRLVQEPGVL